MTEFIFFLLAFLITKEYFVRKLYNYEKIIICFIGCNSPVCL